MIRKCEMCQEEKMCHSRFMDVSQPEGIYVCTTCSEQVIAYIQEIAYRTLLRKTKEKKDG